MLKLDALNIKYGDRLIVKDVSFSVQAGEIVSIIGPNGSGKSTILKGITGLIPCAGGNVYINGQNLNELSVRDCAQQLCMLGQSHVSPMDMTVHDLVSFGRMPHKKWYERLDLEDHEIIEWALEQTKMMEFKHRLVHSLSGGESRRAWLAMALAQRPGILLLDEPTTYLDIAHQLDVLELVKSLNQDLKLTIVMVMHDLNHAMTYSDKVCVIEKGSLIDYGVPSEILNRELIRNVYRVETEIEERASARPRIHVMSRVRP